MPLLRFYLAPNLLSPAEKHELAKKITDFYRSRSPMPAFYIDVIYIEVPPDSIYIGGEESGDFIRLCIEHIYMNFPNEVRQLSYLDGLDKILTPTFQSKGLRWEYHINNTPRELWKVQGLVPPPFGSSAEQVWMKENRATPYE
jgi:phenylpyruvate tautomerase PptA (4-oxalocrotonate tautomerase family)